MITTTFVRPIFYSISITLLVCCCSCSKFLDKKSNDKLVTPSGLDDLQGLLNDEGIMNMQRTPGYGQTSCDEYFLKTIDYNALNEGDQKRYTWRYYFFGTGNDWSAGYNPVYNANLVLESLEKIPRQTASAKQWDNTKGAALFYRSYYFLCLLWNYAKAYDEATAASDWGIALRTSSDFNVPSVRATNKQSYSQVINDTKEAIRLLPDYPGHVLQPSKAAAYGLLARCYLSMRDYPNALLYADSCLKLNNQLIDYNKPGDVDIKADFPFNQFNKETICYTEMNLFFSNIYYTFIKARVDTTLYSLYDNNDLRKDGYFVTNDDGYVGFKGQYTGSFIYFSGIATDEMYLVRAECNIRAGNVASGLGDLNTLLLLRYKTGTFTPYADLAQPEALSIVLKERQKELLMRGLRWMDLKRLNKEGNNIVLKRKTDSQEFTLLPNANFYALPIPEDIIKMTGMPQNDL